jgi:hypothetical protein
VSVATIRTGFASALATLGTNVATAPDALTPPCLLVGMPRIQYHQSYGGLTMQEWTIYAVVPRIADQAAVDKLDAWADVTGVLAALNADRTLGGACATLVVREAVPETISTAQGVLPCLRYLIEVSA